MYAFLFGVFLSIWVLLETYCLLLAEAFWEAGEATGEGLTEVLLRPDTWRFISTRNLGWRVWGELASLLMLFVVGDSVASFLFIINAISFLLFDRAFLETFRPYCYCDELRPSATILLLRLVLRSIEF